MKNSKIESTPVDTIPQRNPLFRTKYPRKANDHQGSNTYGVSLTIPNETYTIRELLNKHTSGIMPDVQKEPIWAEDVSHDSIDLQKAHRLDIVEKQELKTQQTKIIQQLDEIVQEQRAKLEKQNERKNEQGSNDKTSVSEAEAKNKVGDNE